ncbi:RNA-directed DNA polymerase, eukaryota, reverse transcriptase zinc-binding domain protein [Tanacetum coccineum]
MEVFSLVLKRQIDREQYFKYHFGCNSIQLSHVVFADDLLEMCHGDTTSVGVIKKALEEFSAYSGLIPNLSKSTVFFGSVQEHMKTKITQILPFGIGKLPVRYLGAPLIAKRLGVKECSPLIEKIKARGESAKGKAKVSGKSICRPKDKGGLGLKDLQTWNEALLAKHIWNIAIKKDTMWVKWVHTVKLRGTSIWIIDADKNDSWGWKNLLLIRNRIREFVSCKIGNGRDTSLWFDNWNSIGPLSNLITHRDIYDARLKIDMKVYEMVKDGKWGWPSEWYDKFPTVTNIGDPMIDDQISDKVVWKDEDGAYKEFSVKEVHNSLCVNTPTVQWWKVVWFSQNIPKHPFILWLAIQDRLSTQDKLQKWGIYAVNRKDLPHLFFKCEFSKDVWEKIKKFADIKSMQSNWIDIIQEISNLGNGNNIGSVVRGLILAASVYYIWQERNGRIFRDERKKSDEIFDTIVDIVKCKLLSNSNAVRKVEENWNISCKRQYKMGFVGS